MSTARRLSRLQEDLPEEGERHAGWADLHPLDFLCAQKLGKEARDEILARYGCKGRPVCFFPPGMPASGSVVVLRNTLGTGHEPGWMEKGAQRLRHAVKPVPVVGHIELSEVDRWRLAWLRYEEARARLLPAGRVLEEEALKAIGDVEKWLPEAVTPELFEWFSSLPEPPDLEAPEDVENFCPSDLPEPPGEGWEETLEEMKRLEYRAGDWRNRETVNFHALGYHKGYRLLGAIEACTWIVAEAAAVKAVQRAAR